MTSGGNKVCTTDSTPELVVAVPDGFELQSIEVGGQVQGGLGFSGAEFTSGSFGSLPVGSHVVTMSGVDVAGDPVTSTGVLVVKSAMTGLLTFDGSGVLLFDGSGVLLFEDE